MPKPMERRATVSLTIRRRLQMSSQLRQRPGGTVQIPAGTYLASIAVTKGGITIQRAGKDATTIKALPNATAASRIVAVANPNGTTIKDLTIDGNKSERSGKKPIVYSLLLYRAATALSKTRE